MQYDMEKVSTQNYCEFNIKELYMVSPIELKRHKKTLILIFK